MNHWRYVQNGQAIGPVDTISLQQLIDNGTLNAESLVWKEGDPNWLPVKSYPEFKLPAASSTVPPASDVPGSVPPNLPPPPPIAGAAPASDAADIENNKVYAILAYISLLFLVPLLAAPNSRFARYHANQGIVLFLATVIGIGGSTILAMIPFIGCIVSFVPFVIMIGVFILMILGIINAAGGQYKPLPLIGHFNVLK